MTARDLGKTRRAKPRVLIAAGGTGGHVAPALAVGAALVELGAEVRYLSGNRRAELQTYSSEKVKPEILDLEAAPRLSFTSIKDWRKLWKAIGACKSLFADWQPTVLLAMGGYVCVPAIMAAKRAKVPYFLHESNAIPGRVTRKYAEGAANVFLGMEGAAGHLSAKALTQVTGTPIRPSLLHRDRALACQELEFDPAKPTLLVVGGSQGALKLNDNFAQAIPYISRAFKQDGAYQILWATGPTHLLEMQRMTREDVMDARVTLKIMGYIEDMASAYAAADVIVSRAGASTLAETTTLGKAMILVPYPHAKDDHQLENARFLAARGAAQVIEERSLRPKAFAEEILELLTGDERRAAMAQAASELGQQKAAELIAESLLSFCHTDATVPAKPPTGAPES
ncbi:MAG: undecaprenyldiphospho-muramoylpentapeptide beta-N-acetylglucosaminyltransferase [Sumerlaeia bacterium]